jgi:hypothetical protein
MKNNDSATPAESTVDISASTLPATVTWSTGIEGAAPKSELATPRLLDRELYLSAPIRTPHRYPRQKNIQGRYYFSSVGAHVWHESQLESYVLRWLDMSKDIVAISAQPMLINFADGSTHTPDMLALHADHRQVVYDVKPERFIPKFAEQFAKTKAFCKQVGFGYEIYHEMPKQVEINMSWLAGFKHIGYGPADDACANLLGSLAPTMQLREAARLLDDRDLARGRSALFHLVWTGVVTFDLTLPISDATLIERKNS